MKKFEFSSERSPPPPATTFNGPQFYNVYKKAEFLRSSENVEQILAKGYELRQKLNDVLPGQSITIEGMLLERKARVSVPCYSTPLLVKRTGINVKVEDYEFTYNRLSGLVAAYAFENRNRFPKIESSEAKALGLVWDNQDDIKCRLYLSAVSGTEHFTNQFSFWPLLCALRKYQLKKMPENLIVKMAKIKNDSGHRMAKVLYGDVWTKALWRKFPGATDDELRQILKTASPQLKQLFTG